MNFKNKKDDKKSIEKKNKILIASEWYVLEFLHDLKVKLVIKVSKEHSNWLNILQPDDISKRLTQNN